MADINTNLEPGTLLNGSFKIEKVIGQGGFGITYLATDLALGRKVAIKEFFPKELCNRETDTSRVSVGTLNNLELVDRLKEKFLKEARNIARFDCPFIIKIFTAFEANGTAYYVMEYIDGENIREIVKREGPMNVARAEDYIRKIGTALEYVHSHHINHLDVKPANIMVRKSDNTPILIDFGLSKNYDDKGHQTSTTPTGISHGYAPIEQYNIGGVSQFSPATDIYSLGATLYYMLTGSTPPSAPELHDKSLTFPSNVPQYLRNVIEKAMSLSKRERHDSVSRFIEEINSQNSQKATYGNFHDSEDERTRIQQPQNFEVYSSEPETPKKPNRQYLIYGGVGVAVIALIAILFAVIPSSDDDEDYDDTEYVTDSENHDNATETPAHESVDLGLSVKWATCNLGADNPWDYGDYYIWGETTPGFRSGYSTMTSSICGNSSYDAATAEWGDGWRMPSAEECNELLNYCTWIWSSMNGVSGFEVRGPNGNSIFLPAAGYIMGGQMQYLSTNGNYWSGTPKNSKDAYYISFHSSYHERRVYDKDRARSIRAVRN